MKFPAEKAVLEAKLVEANAKVDKMHKLHVDREIAWNVLHEAIEEVTKLEKMIDRLPPMFEVGDGVSLMGHTDVTPYEVIEVSKTGKLVTIREMKATRDPNWKPEMVPGGFAAHCINNREQKWILESNPEGTIKKISLRKVKLNPRHNYGMNFVEKWVPVREKVKIGEYPVLPYAKKFYDYNF